MLQLGDPLCAPFSEAAVASLDCALAVANGSAALALGASASAKVMAGTVSGACCT